MLTIHYIPEVSDPFSAGMEAALNRSNRVGEVYTSRAQGYCTITYQGPEGFWNPLDDCDNGDSGIWVFARVAGAEGFYEGEALNFTPVNAGSFAGPFGEAGIARAQAQNMTFWLLKRGNDFYLAVDDRMFNTRNRRMISFVHEEGAEVPAAPAAAEKFSGAAVITLPGEEQKSRGASANLPEKAVADAAAPDCRHPSPETVVDRNASTSKAACPLAGAQEPLPQAVSPDVPPFLFCRMCGRKIPGDSRFCMFCGVEVKIL